MISNIETYTYSCTDCGTKQPVELDVNSFDDPPPDSVTNICGERWGGCGSVHVMTLVQGGDEE